MIDNEKKVDNKEDIAEVIRRKLDAHKKQEAVSKNKFKYKPVKLRKGYVSRTTGKPHYNKTKKRIMPIVIDALIILVLIVIIISAGYIFYDAFIKDKQRELDAGLGRLIIDNDEIATLIVDDSVNLDEVETVEVVLSDSSRDYTYSTYPTKEYDFYPDELGLEDFEDIVSVSVSFQYKSDFNNTVIIPIPVRDDENVSDVIQEIQTCTNDVDCPVDKVCSEGECVFSTEIGSFSPFLRFWDWIKNAF